MKKNTLLLLHICCAPCGAGCINHPFLNTGDRRELILYYSNSNLDSADEFQRRLEYVRKLGKLYSIPVEVDPYDHEAWLQAVKGLESAPEGGGRCRRCFRTAERCDTGNGDGTGCEFAQFCRFVRR